MTDFCSRVIIGTAVGDSIGLPAEGMSKNSIERRWPQAWKHCLFFGKGMISDDTEHTVFVAQCLIQNPNNPIAFQKALAWKLRFWLLGIPAGIGFATLRSILKLWIGFPPDRSGVFSAGNGPAMRSAIIGAFFSTEPVKIREFVRVSTRLTHTDPKAETAAVAVALTAAWACTHSDRPDKSLMTVWRDISPTDKDWTTPLDAIHRAIEIQSTVAEFAASVGLTKGVSGYAYHTVPVALYAWLHHHGDFQKTVEAVIRCGGDTDTVGAITGALAAIGAPVPEDWQQEVSDLPISLSFLQRLGKQADQASQNGSEKPVDFNWLLLPFRNLLFFGIVLLHGFRRLLP